MPPLIITLTNNLRLQNVPPDIIKILTEKLKFLNPKWLENERMGRWNRGTPKELRFYDKVGTAEHISGSLRVARLVTIEQADLIAANPEEEKRCQRQSNARQDHADRDRSLGRADSPECCPLRYL